MVSFKDGILKIEKSKDKERFFRLPFEICLYLGLSLYHLMRSPLHYVGVALLIAGSAVIISGKLYYSRVNHSILSIWYLAFTCFAEMSSMWAYSPHTAAFRYVKYMLLILVFCFGMVQYANTKRDVERLMDIFLFIALTISLIEFIGTPFSDWFSGYFGSTIGGGNTNTFSYVLMFAASMSFFKAYIKNKRLWYIATIIFLSGCILSSSRKAVLMTGFQLLFILFFSFGRKHHFLHFFLAISAGAIALVLFMKNPVLYNIIGNRLVTLFDFVNGSSAYYERGSLQLREYYIDFAELLFRRKPIFGQGFANFATLLDAETNAGNVYAHNNYWEILADLGIVGFILYYWLYAYMAITLIIRFFKKEFSGLKVLAFAMFVSELVLEWGVISMFFPYHQTVIALMFLFINTDESEDNKKFYYSGNKSKNNSSVS